MSSTLQVARGGRQAGEPPPHHSPVRHLRGAAHHQTAGPDAAVLSRRPLPGGDRGAAADHPPGRLRQPAPFHGGIDALRAPPGSGAAADLRSNRVSAHYFSPVQRAGHRVREVSVTLRGRTFGFLTDRAVFATRGVDRGTRLLIETMSVGEGDVILDLGCGYGVIGLVAAALAPHGHAHLVDVNARAADLARENAVRNGIGNVTVHVGDGVEPVRGIAFDLVLTNPPARAGQGARTLARHVEALFGNVTELAKGSGFRVYAATREPAGV